MTLISEDGPLTQANGAALRRVRLEEPAAGHIPAPRPQVDDEQPTQTTTTPTAPRRVTAHRTAARHAVYVGHGAAALRAERRERRGEYLHHRMAKAAEAVGDHAKAAEWMKQAADHRKERHERRLALVRSAPHMAKCAAVGTGLTVGGLLGLGVVLALAGHDAHEALVPLKVAIEVIRVGVDILGYAWLPTLCAIPVALLVRAWRKGRAHGRMPQWLVTSADLTEELVIDERTITLALRALNLREVNAYLKQGLPLQYLTPARTDGRGTHAVLRLPDGLPAETVAKKRTALATGLHRAAKEVWPTVGAEAGILDLWVADKGALAEGAGAYPLLSEGFVDLFKGVPFGKTLRGTPIIAPVLERNTITGGMPGQGKSASARVLMAGAALDYTAELRIWVPDSNFDFETFEPRCSRYVMGAEDEKIAEILNDLRALHAEVQARGKLLIKHEVPAVTRALASRGVGLHPLVCLLEEAHVAIQHPKYGKEISQLLVDVVKLGRKRAVHMIVSTQAPTKDSMPRDVTRNCSNGLAFAVGDHVANDGLLGQGAYRAGHRATELIPGVDRGTCVAKGLTGERSDIVQVYFLDVARGSDQVTPLIRRSLEEIKRRGRAVPGTGDDTGPAAPAEEPVDVLADVVEILRGERRIRSEEAVHRLKSLRPDHYRDWTTTELTAALRPYGAEPYKTSGIMHVSLDRVTEAMADRDAAAESDAESA